MALGFKSIFLVLIFSVCMHAKLFQLCSALCDLMDCVAHQVPLSMGFSRQESLEWIARSGLPCPPPRDLPDPVIEPTTLTSPVLQIITHKKQQIQSILVKNKQTNKQKTLAFPDLYVPLKIYLYT